MGGMNKLKPSKLKVLLVIIMNTAVASVAVYIKSYLRKTTVQILSFRLFLGRNLWKPGNPE